MKICIIGAGAMGGLYGTRLIMAGEEVHFVDNRQSVVDNINQQGVHLTGVDGEHWIPAKASVTASDFFPADIAFIHTDTNNSAAAPETSQRCARQTGWLVHHLPKWHRQRRETTT
ncbi:MAG: hypothetical protein CM1200mP18_12960 [Gammaproteobacteria bacterium]|nr:MAG: hypothetical protein CM1200mP18_12960 [Gammaproteobacteria bacterium]